jgi:nicotinamidase/pyrazinamidase
MEVKIGLVIDCQKDFCPGGSLAVKNGDNIIPVINTLLNSKFFDYKFATQDWHVSKHCSFASRYDVPDFTLVDNEMKWPDHCIMGTKGAELHDDLDINLFDNIFRKGVTKDTDSFSAFLDNDRKLQTGLAAYINVLNYNNTNNNDIKIYIMGIATDVCVFYTALDSKLIYKYDTYLVLDACAEVTTDNLDVKLNDLKTAGVHIITSDEILEK